MSFAAQFGHNLASHRRKADLSQEELAFAPHCTAPPWGQLERGERIPRADTVVKLAGSFSVSAGDLLDGLAWTPGGTVAGRFGGA